jgi:hypothetical protein
MEANREQRQKPKNMSKYQSREKSLIYITWSND